MNSNGFLSPFPQPLSAPHRASFMTHQAPKLRAASIKRVSSLTKDPGSLKNRVGQKFTDRKLGTSLMEVHVHPLKGQLTKDLESSSEESLGNDASLLSPVKIVTMEQFYEQRKSKLNPMNIMLSHRRDTSITKSTKKNSIVKIDPKSIKLKKMDSSEKVEGVDFLDFNKKEGWSFVLNNLILPQEDYGKGYTNFGVSIRERKHLFGSIVLRKS